MLDENDPLALALFHARALVKLLETAESFRITGQHDAANEALPEARIAHAAFKVVQYATESRDEMR